MSDIVERLRGWQGKLPVMTVDLKALTREAADEIERLRDAIVEMELVTTAVQAVDRHEQAEIEQLRHRCRELDASLTYALDTIPQETLEEAGAWFKKNWVGGKQIADALYFLKEKI